MVNGRSPLRRSGGTRRTERLDGRLACDLDSMARPFSMARVDAIILVSQVLGLGSQWKVVKSEMDVLQRKLRLALDFPAGTKLACARCGQLCAAHGMAEKEWRHLDIWQHRTDLRARVPRVSCAEHGVLQVEVL